MVQRCRSEQGTSAAGMILSVLQGYQDSEAFLGRAASTRRSYIARIIHRNALPTSHCRRSPIVARAASSWHGAIASPRMLGDDKQTMHGVCLPASCHGAWTAELKIDNPCSRGGRLYRGSRAEKIWTPDG